MQFKEDRTPQRSLFADEHGSFQDNEESTFKNAFSENRALRFETNQFSGSEKPIIYKELKPSKFVLVPMGKNFAASVQ